MSLVFKMLEPEEHILRAYLRVNWTSAWRHSSTTTIIFFLLQGDRRSKGVCSIDLRQPRTSRSVWGSVRCLSSWLISLRGVSRLRAMHVIRKDSNVGHQTTKAADFAPVDPHSAEELSVIRRTMKTIFLNARNCRDGGRDENAWCDDVFQPLLSPKCVSR